VTGPVTDGGDDHRVNRTELREAIEAGRRDLERTLTGIPDAAMADRIDQTWTRKDVVAHLEAWERRVVDLLDQLRAGGPSSESVETDELNERWWRRDHDRSLADVRAGERDAYAKLLAAIDGASDEELFDGAHFPWTEGDPFAGWFRGNADEHYAEHLDQLMRPAR
jgi:hypothetical protein